MKKSIISLAIAGLLPFTGAFAQSTSGIYLDVMAGSASQSTNYTTPEEDGKLSDNSLSFGIRAGYQFNHFFALEAGYINYGEIDDEFIDSWDDLINEKAKSSSFTLGVRGSYPIVQNFYVVGRAGLSTWDYKYSETDSAFPGEVFESKDSGKDPYYGVGLQYNFGRNFQAGIDYSRVKMGNAFNSAIKYLESEGVDMDGISVNHTVSNIALYVGMRF